MELRAFYLHRMDSLRGPEKLFMYELGLDCRELAALDQAELNGLLGRTLAFCPRKYPGLLELAKADQQAAAREPWNTVGLWEPQYPAWLEATWDPPFMLWYRGNLPPPGQILGALVGTRQPSNPGRLAARDLAMDLASREIGVVSGLAFGIDGAAHRGALAGGGYTLAVLPGGIDQVVPLGNRTLGMQILSQGGALVSEFPPGVGVRKYGFPRRNRIISGLCPWLVVVEAPRNSGALISGHFSLDEGREVFVHSGCLDSLCNQGGRDLLFQGAAAVGSVDDIWRQWKGT